MYCTLWIRTQSGVHLQVILAYVDRSYQSLHASDRLWWPAIYYPLPVKLDISAPFHNSFIPEEGFLASESDWSPHALEAYLRYQC